VAVVGAALPERTGRAFRVATDSGDEQGGVKRRELDRMVGTFARWPTPGL
jgi:hypothetical protein